VIDNEKFQPLYFYIFTADAKMLNFYQRVVKHAFVPVALCQISGAAVRLARARDYA
jgi:hypothetical protein